MSHTRYYPVISTTKCMALSMPIATPIKIEKQSLKLITPSFPTPKHLRHYNIGFVDEFVFGVDVGVVLFFPNNNAKFVSRLEKSLAKTLTRFSPLAGRYVEETHTIDCDDHGAEFKQATANVKLEDYLVSDVDVKLVDNFFPSKVGAADSLLTSQVTTFKCGGIALSISSSHRIIDAATLCTFINEWAAINREETEPEFSGPGFNSSLLFPGRGLSPLPVPHMTDDMLSKYTIKKLIFSERQITKMKAKSTRRWSKVQLVSAIIWKTFMFMDLALRGQRRESAHIQPVSLREKMEMASLIPKDSCGNIWGLCVTECKAFETTTAELVDLLTDSVKRTISNFAKGYHDCEEGQQVVLDSLLNMTNLPQSTNIVITSSWLNFPFYEVDFGFGKPIQVAPWTVPTNGVTYLMGDVEGNAVNAFTCLHVKDVPYFEEALQHVIDAFVA